MRCKKAKILISMERDRELPEKESLLLARHVSTCAGCAEDRVALAQLSERMHAWPDEEPSEWLAQKFAYKLNELMSSRKTAHHRRETWAWRTGMSAAVAAGIAVVLLAHGRFTTISPQTPAYRPATVATVPEVKTPTIVEQETPKPDTVVKAEQPKLMASNTIAPVERTYSHRPRRTSKSHSSHNKRYHINYTVMASNIETDRSYDTEQMIEPISRHRAVQPEEERRVEEKILAAKKARVDAVFTVARNIDGAGATVDQSVQRVRGTLRKVSYALADTTPRSYGAIDSQGGTSL